MKIVSFRTVIATLCAAGACIGASPASNAAQSHKTSPVIAHFAARAPFEGDSGSPAKIDILIERWSTDQERDELDAALTKRGPAGLLPVLQGIRRRAGVMLMPGVHGVGTRARLRKPVNLFFAREIDTAKGHQLVIATDHLLAFGEPTQDWPPDFAFSLLDIRFGPDGTGVGKVAPAAKTVFNKSTRTIEAANYGKLPARLVEVKAEKS